jgi:hypothetical protein
MVDLARSFCRIRADQGNATLWLMSGAAATLAGVNPRYGESPECGGSLVVRGDGSPGCDRSGAASADSPPFTPSEDFQWHATRRRLKHIFHAL